MVRRSKQYIIPDCIAKQPWFLGAKEISPTTSIRPDFRGNSFNNKLSMLLFPLPTGPTIATNCPGDTSRLMLFNVSSVESPTQVAYTFSSTIFGDILQQERPLDTWHFPFEWAGVLLRAL
ncbi:unnamed protein product [Acanthoscelides obtectus]|uniref:Uncharacterized protein n=1 Tax=Acanthoscelides obtectus TaxID=200917 RepID=A0A9P0LKE8_ACAOB|nr:unnamed protein product [Acanthoscelides obtectus]CAK1658573.1 hypothetical protein AOBTE_LOCUS20996 [Acanthoscelides obtectus]